MSSGGWVEQCSKTRCPSSFEVRQGPVVLTGMGQVLLFSASWGNGAVKLSVLGCPTSLD